jgi:hypothetical protein
MPVGMPISSRLVLAKPSAASVGIGWSRDRIGGHVERRQCLQPRALVRREHAEWRAALRDDVVVLEDRLVLEVA